MYVCIYIYIYIHTYIHTYIHACMHAYMGVYYAHKPCVTATLNMRDESEIAGLVLKKQDVQPGCACAVNRKVDTFVQSAEQMNSLETTLTPNPEKLHKHYSVTKR